MFSDPAAFPWTIGYNPNYQTEARIYGKISSREARRKIAVLYQNDGFGKEYLIGLKDGLGADNAGMIVKEASYETSEPTVDSQVVTLQGSGATSSSSPRRRNSPRKRSASPRSRLERDALSQQRLALGHAVLKPAGLEKCKGLITAHYGKDPTDPRWKDDAGMKAWAAFVDKYMSPGRV